MIEVGQLQARQGRFLLEIGRLSLPQGSYAVLSGPSGSGKTTLLEVLCGLLRPLRGSVRLDGRDALLLRPGERRIGYLPQDLALFPRMTAGEQIGLGLKARRLAPERIEERVRQVARIAGVEPLLGRLPRQLSGGEAQRVALGRAIAPWPRILLLDEPLGSLDPRRHQEMSDLLRDVHQETGATVLHVAHDPRETRRLGGTSLAMEDLCARWPPEGSSF